MQLRKDAKPSVVSKTLQVMRILGFADEVESQPVVQKRSSARSNRSEGVSVGYPSSPAPAHAPAHQHAHEEVDLLGFGSMSIQQPAQPASVPQVVSQPNIYASPPSAPMQAPPAPQQEVSVRAHCVAAHCQFVVCVCSQLLTGIRLLCACAATGRLRPVKLLEQFQLRSSAAAAAAATATVSRSFHSTRASPGSAGRASAHSEPLREGPLHDRQLAAQLGVFRWSERWRREVGFRVHVEYRAVSLRGGKREGFARHSLDGNKHGRRARAQLSRSVHCHGRPALLPNAYVCELNTTTASVVNC